MQKEKILLLEDEEILRITLKDDLEENNYIVYDFDNPASALEFFKNSNCKIIISDIRLPQYSGLEFLSKIKSLEPDCNVIIMTAFGSVESAVEAMKKGAYDYITKPFNINELLIILNRLREIIDLKSRNREFQQHFTNKYNFDLYIGKSVYVSELKKLLRTIASSDSNVLITGETGTGKELIANLIHYNSSRKNKPLIKVNCAILSREVLESELFGHEKGSYTGADKVRIGRFEAANGGTIFLDDIDDFPLESQVKLLRVIQEQELERIGSNETIKIDVRIIASTKNDLLKLAFEGKFRNDLFYRLNILPVNLTPLKERKEDIPVLFNYFINLFAKGKNFNISTDFYKILESYKFPGNTRELKNLAERLSILCNGCKIDSSDLPDEFIYIDTKFEQQMNGNFDSSNDFVKRVESFEIDLITNALKLAKGNKAKAAKILGLPSSTLKSKIEKYNIDLF